MGPLGSYVQNVIFQKLNDLGLSQFKPKNGSKNDIIAKKVWRELNPESRTTYHCCVFHPLGKEGGDQTEDAR